MADGSISDRSRWLVLGWQWSLWGSDGGTRCIRDRDALGYWNLFTSEQSSEKDFTCSLHYCLRETTEILKRSHFFPMRKMLFIIAEHCRSESVLLLFLCFIQKTHPQSILKHLSCESRAIGMVLVCLQRWCWAALNSLNLLLTINVSLFNVLFCK